MESKTPLDKVFTRRALLIGGAQAALLVLLGGRLGWLQIAHGDRYKTLADENRIDLQILPPARGDIVDIQGFPLARGEQAFALLLMPEEARDIPLVLRRLQGIIDLPNEVVEATLRRSKRTPSFVPLEVKGPLPWTEVAAISVRLPDLPGLAIEARAVRRYPLGAAGAHPIGYVGAVAERDLKAPGAEPLLSVPGFKIGKAGLERSLESYVRGTAGAAEVEVNARGRKVRELARRQGAQGARVQLTLHAGLQAATMVRLAREKSASAVLMDAQNGAIYVLASHPGFNPNAFVDGISGVEWEGLLADPGLPLTNKAIAGLYPPASTFKMIVALAALEAGTLDAQTSIFCPGHLDYGGHRFHCWEKGGHGTVNVLSALERSCDTFFYQVGLNTGIDAIASMARRLGLGAAPDLGLSEEKTGLVPDRAWKATNMRDKTWHGGETVVASIGQGYLQSTPLQLATMTARLVNPLGLAVAPYIVHAIGVKRVEQKYPQNLGLSPEHLALVRAGMESVIIGERGTARGSAIPANFGWQMGGKTGTAQVRRITMADRVAGVRNEDLDWLQRHHALFVGYAPTTSPRYACCVVVEHGVGGARSAAPIAKGILMDAMRIAPGI